MLPIWEKKYSTLLIAAPNYLQYSLCTIPDLIKRSPERHSEIPPGQTAERAALRESHPAPAPKPPAHCSEAVHPAHLSCAQLFRCPFFGRKLLQHSRWFIFMVVRYPCLTQIAECIQDDEHKSEAKDRRENGNSQQ